MFYPRVTTDGKLISDDQMVGSRELLATKRIVSLFGVITGEADSSSLLLAFDSISHDPIKMIISSPGGELDGAFLLYDTIRLLKSPVITIGRYCASAAAFILAAGKERYLFPHAKTMLHLPAGVAAGDSHDWDIQHEEMIKYKSEIVTILKECGAKPSREQILQDMDRDFWLSPKEAIDYGLADKIVTRKEVARWLK